VSILPSSGRISEFEIQFLSQESYKTEAIANRLQRLPGEEHKWERLGGAGCRQTSNRSDTGKQTGTKYTGHIVFRTMGQPVSICNTIKHLPMLLRSGLNQQVRVYMVLAYRIAGREE
jgi:hypothetical protein